MGTAMCIQPQLDAKEDECEDVSIRLQSAVVCDESGDEVAHASQLHEEIEEVPPTPRDRLVTLLQLRLDGEGQITKASIAFVTIRFNIFLALIALAVAFVDEQTAKTYWWIPVMGILACAIPSAGIPVAGGILFFPFLNMAGLEPQECVAFGVATQAIGVGLFAPAGWLVKDPSMIEPWVLLWSVPAALCGLFLGLLALPLSGETVVWAFTAFCVLVLGHTIWGGFHTLAQQDEKLANNHPAVIIQLCGGGVLGGLMVAWIGIGIEKVLFVLLTWHSMDAMRASITGITAVGLVSCAAAVYQGALNRIPWDLWLLVLPGICFGSMFGTLINEVFGKQAVLRAFMVLLVFDIARGAVVLSRRRV